MLQQHGQVTLVYLILLEQIVGHVNNNRYVDDVIITLNTYHAWLEALTETNVVIANNIGTAQSFQAKLLYLLVIQHLENIVDPTEAVL